MLQFCNYLGRGKEERVCSLHGIQEEKLIPGELMEHPTSINSLGGKTANRLLHRSQILPNSLVSLCVPLQFVMEIVQRVVAVAWMGTWSVVVSGPSVGHPPIHFLPDFEDGYNDHHDK